MCARCRLTAMMDFAENPNPQEGRVYPKGWDLAGYYSPEPFGARVGYAEDDTLRMVYEEPGLCLSHMVIAQAFTGAPMEHFYDGQFFCYRPAILKRNKPQPPAWHVMRNPEPEEISEEDQRAAIRDLEEMLRAAGHDPREVMGSLEDDLPDDE